MYVSGQVGAGKLEVTVKVATNYENRGGGWGDVPSATDVWVNIQGFPMTVALRMTRNQLAGLVIGLRQEEQALRDATRVDDAESVNLVSDTPEPDPLIHCNEVSERSDYV